MVAKGAVVKEPGSTRKIKLVVGGHLNLLQIKINV